MKLTSPLIIAKIIKSFKQSTEFLFSFGNVIPLIESI